MSERMITAIAGFLVATIAYSFGHWRGYEVASHHIETLEWINRAIVADCGAMHGGGW